MFHLKLLTKETHPDLASIQSLVSANPNRHFTTHLNGFGFAENEVNQLLQNKCGICIQNEDNFTKKSIEEFVDLGKESVVLRPKDFSETDLENYLQKGASLVVGKEDGFDIFQIKKLVVKGKDKTYVIGEKLLENHITDYLKSGGSVLLKHKDLEPRIISKLLPFGENRIHIHGGGFSNFRIKKFLEGKAFITFGKGNQLDVNQIEEKVKKFKNQIRIESNHPIFDKDWIEKMEGLGAVII